LLKQKKEGLEKRLAVFTIDSDQEVYPHGGEPIFRDGTVSSHSSRRASMMKLMI
jgi:hypothetical protein